MENQDILTSLKNAIERGDSLENAKQIAINSGYNPREVEHASRFLGNHTMPKLEPKPEEHLTMPEKKQGFFSRIFKRKPKEEKPIKNNNQEFSQHIKNEISNNKQNQSISQKPTQSINQNPHFRMPPSSNTKQIINEHQNEPLNKPKQSHKKEIILLIVLLILIGILVISIFLRDQILSLFSG